MSDQRKSILDKLYECVNNGVDWGVKYAKHPCPPKKKSVKKGSETFDDDWQKRKNRETDLESKEKSGRDSQGTGRDNSDFHEKSQDNSDFDKQNKIPQPEARPCCDIPMQDPSSPCYETEENQSKSCQCKKVYSNEPREPSSTCNCSQHDRLDIRLEKA